MEEYKVKCKKCNRFFIVRVTTMNVPGGKDKEEIFCPYEDCCEENGHRMTSGFVETYKIDANE